MVTIRGLAFGLGLCLLLGLTSCGGGSSDATTSPPVTPTTASVSGKVIDTDSANAGVNGASVSLVPSGGSNRTVMTQVNGTFQASSLEPGPYTLTLTLPSGYALGTNETGARTVMLVASTTAASVSDFQLIRTRGSVTGSARNGTTPLAASSVTLNRPGFTPRSATTDAAGTYSFTAVQTGPWTVALSIPSALRGTSGETGTRAINVESNQTTQVSAFTLEPRPVSNVVEVHILNATFTPANLTIPVGTTVRWINDDPGTHTITPQTATQPGVFQRTAFGGSTGVVLEHTFSSPNQFYRYRCEPHSDNFTSGMVGAITVQ